ncbi:conserved hypothetical protein [Gluconacetobacter diazotrophicus PA1 5]|uniref:Uncharacterized protein n=2 Tax=Gluconacetobacter diazotrophicus TaxID=33996 RepID=A9HIY7_GLUDA|nr:hypothetical protein [Gluconacetobacter diazotrophicus]ACI49911.1 conserved hypothetical protein [Gluconacetobacter diazotrophicus PA1 5]MBB2156462.1 hypothetical protein [Gluconacetobacter diazotrophicus]TWB05955.1 hypothetical protein FBZ86_11427 [Gluconacetobacter diazotrophicus]CAP55831.1 hypothetical protein GDI1888 [Gluconacetobacter diazotrophicus PA1 5]
MRILSLSAVLAGLLAAAGPAGATPLPETCAQARTGGLSVSGNVAAARDYVLRFSPGGEAPSLHARMVTVKGGDAAGTDARDILNAASLVLLGALTNHHGAGCPSEYFASSVGPLLNGLKAGQGYDVAWTAPVVNNGGARLSFAALHLHLGGAELGGPVVVALDVRDAQASGNTVLASLLPQQARSNFSIPAQSLGPLLAATAGHPARSVLVPVTITTLMAQHGDLRLNGRGTAMLTGNADANSAAGHLSLSNLPELIATLRAAGQARATTALILANLVGRHADADTSWDVEWQGGVLTINQIPLPLR